MMGSHRCAFLHVNQPLFHGALPLGADNLLQLSSLSVNSSPIRKTFLSFLSILEGLIPDEHKISTSCGSLNRKWMDGRISETNVPPSLVVLWPFQYTNGQTLPVNTPQSWATYLASILWAWRIQQQSGSPSRPLNFPREQTNKQTISIPTIKQGYPDIPLANSVITLIRPDQTIGQMIPGNWLWTSLAFPTQCL